MSEAIQIETSVRGLGSAGREIVFARTLGVDALVKITLGAETIQVPPMALALAVETVTEES